METTEVRRGYDGLFRPVCDICGKSVGASGAADRETAEIIAVSLLAPHRKACHG